MACPNGSAPLLLPWTNTSVSADGTILTRGVSFSIGTPGQPFSLRPSTSSDNAFLNNVAECTAATNKSCIGQSGGIFDSTASTSFAQVSYGGWEGSRDSIELASKGSYIFFDDAIAFGTKPATNKFPLFPLYTNGSKDAAVEAFTENEPDAKATLPLGHNSTFLNYLVDSGQASSRTYGLWVGSESQDAPQDGLLVVGGYDESRLKSAASKFPMYSDCPTCAILTAITYDVGGKSTTLFDNTTETLIVNLDPYASNLELPSNMLNNLGAADKTAVWNATSRKFEFPAATAPTGTLTITISDMNAPLGDASKPSVATYKTTIPATELFHRPRAYNAAGVFEVDNATVYNMAVTNQTGSNSVATFGLPFFTQNYLVVDPDARNFQLAPAVVTAAAPAAAKVKQVCRVLPTDKKISMAGPIAGAVIGSIIATLAFVGLFLWFRRRKRTVQELPRHYQRSSGDSHAPTTTTAISTDPLYPHHSNTTNSSEDKSLNLPLQAPAPTNAPAYTITPPTAIARTPSGHIPVVSPTPPPARARSNRSGTSQRDYARRDLNHSIFRHVDEANDGRLLDERPMGLGETIHSRASLPRMAAEHEV